jgi:hypothetical protein
MSTCPFCHTDVPHGAIVCRGCGASYGYDPRFPSSPGRYWVGVAIPGIVSFLAFSFSADEIGKFIFRLLLAYPMGILFLYLLILGLFKYSEKAWWRHR